MRPRISVITLGVTDLKRALEFYRDGLGLPTEGIVGEEFEDGAVVFFDLENGLKLALWPHQSLAKDAGFPLPPPPPTPTPTSLTELSLGHNVASENQVDEVMAQAQKAGANIVKPAHKTFW